MALPTVATLTADLGVYVDTPPTANPYVGECCEQAVTFIGHTVVPGLQPTHVEPVTLTWPDGSTVALSREGSLVTAVVTPANPNTLPFGAEDLPAEFAPLGNAYYFGYASLSAPGPGRYIVQIIEDGESAVVAGFVGTGDPSPYAPFTAQWAADPIESGPGSADPDAYIVPEIFERMPQQQYEREVMELGADLFYRRQAKNGVVSVNAMDGVIARISKDPYAASEARLIRFLGLGFS